MFWHQELELRHRVRNLLGQACHLSLPVNNNVGLHFEIFSMALNTLSNFTIPQGNENKARQCYCLNYGKAMTCVIYTDRLRGWVKSGYIIN